MRKFSDVVEIDCVPLFRFSEFDAHTIQSFRDSIEIERFYTEQSHN